MKKKKLNPSDITNAQHKWLLDEKERTGNGIAAILRSLIQDKITESGKKDS